MTARYAQSTDSINGFFVEKDVPANADFSDDQQLSISNDTLILEDGGFIDLSVYKDTFNQIDSTGIANLGFCCWTSYHRYRSTAVRFCNF